MGPSGSLTLKHRSRHQNRHPKCFKLNIMVTDIFLQNVGRRNAFPYVSRSNYSRCFFYSFEDHGSRCFLIHLKTMAQANVFNCGDNLSSMNQIYPQMWFYRVVTLRGQGHPWQSKGFLSDCYHLPISTHVKFHWNLIASFSVIVESHHWLKGGRETKRRRKKERIKEKQFDWRWHFVMQITPWRSDLR